MGSNYCLWVERLLVVKLIVCASRFYNGRFLVGYTGFAMKLR